jgi:translation elongation factor EF-Tu-like GTPase
MTRPERSNDVEVEITFLTTEEGGRKGPAFSNYRPQFYYDGHDWDAVHTYPSVEAVYPGQTVIAHLCFLSPQYHVGKLYPGKEFLLREGQRIVGHGKVTKILDLEKSAKEAEAREAKKSGTTESAT